MKSRKFTQKLVLNKKTVANLNGAALKRVVAGGPTAPAPSALTPNTCFALTCPTYTGEPDSDPCCKTC